MIEGRGRTINSFNEDRVWLGVTRTLGSISHFTEDVDVVVKFDSRKAVLPAFAITHKLLVVTSRIAWHTCADS